MTDPGYQPGECNETAGFLFSHRCGEIATDNCVTCGKPICAEHKVLSGEGLVECVTCTRRAQRDWEGDDASFWRSRPGYHGSPYFYSYHYYPHYHQWRDRDDFVDADEGMLGGPEAAAADVFEDDMGAS